MNIHDGIQSIKGVGEIQAQKYKKLSIKTVADLLFHVPRRYEDYTNLVSVSQMQPGKISLMGRFSDVKKRYTRRRLHITSATFSDDTGYTEIVWFNQPYRAEQIPLKQDVLLSGELKLSGKRFSIANPKYTIVASESHKQGTIVPVYPETAGLTSAQIHKHTTSALAQTKLPALLPSKLRVDTKELLQTIHSPTTIDGLNTALKKWNFLKLLEVVLLGFMLRQERIKLKAPQIQADTDTLKTFTNGLPFKLTDAQRRSSWEIIQDLSSHEPMNRLLQGDVGSGKTITAVLGALAALSQGFQVAIIAPTEIVARQHFESFKELLPDYKPALLTSSLTARQKILLKNKLARGEQSLIVGTHAVIQPDVEFKSLGLVVIDEQHRFGVKQREELAKRSKQMPHVLSMTATPIPRTLALTVFSDLDVSIIDEMPPGRKPVKTTVGGPRNRKKIISHIQTELQKGHQGYVVCPLIDESDTLGVKSVENEVKRLQAELPDFKVEKLHGKLKPDDKQKILHDFKSGKINLLVATTVVEVGVNVPNATVMLIEGAERFGLAQLHQLRGRVGRADKQAYCFALTTKTNQAQARMEAFESTTDGFRLAELDLKQRGQGDLYGTRQSGFDDIDASVLTQPQLIKRARELAEEFVKKYELNDYPLLQYRLDRIKYRANRN